MVRFKEPPSDDEILELEESVRIESGDSILNMLKAHALLSHMNAIEYVALLERAPEIAEWEAMVESEGDPASLEAFLLEHPEVEVSPEDVAETREEIRRRREEES